VLEQNVLNVIIIFRYSSVKLELHNSSPSNKHSRFGAMRTIVSVLDMVSTPKRLINNL
jgi:hypothetical protein